MLEFYQLRITKRQTLQSDKVRSHEIIHMLGYHASIHAEINNKTKSINRNLLREITWRYKVIAQINQHIIKINN